MSHGGKGHAPGTAPHGENAPGNILEATAHTVGVSLTLGYALLSCVGVVFETLLLRSFGTDFLTFAEPEDFLMAGLRHPVVLAFVVLSVTILLVTLGIIRLGNRYSARYAAWRSATGQIAAIRTFRKVIPVVAIAAYFFIFTRIYAQYEAGAIHAGEAPLFQIEFQQNGAVPATPPVRGFLIATTARYLFVVDAATRTMQVVPVNAVRQLFSERQPGSRAAKKDSGL